MIMNRGEYGSWFSDLWFEMFPPNIIYHAVQDSGEENIVPESEVPEQYRVQKVDFSLFNGYRGLGDTFNPPATDATDNNVLLFRLMALAVAGYFVLRATVHFK